MQEVILKKVMFGGYDCYEVMNHINALQIKLNRIKKDSDKLNDLKAEAERIKSAIAESDGEIDRLTREIAEYEENLKKNCPAKAFLKQTEEYTDQYIDTARSLEKSVKDMTSAQLIDARKKIDELCAYLENVSDMIGETFISISDLRKEYEEINKSYKEMISETEPAEKKEKKTAAKKTAKKSATKKSTKKKSDATEALELIRQSEEKYNSI